MKEILNNQGLDTLFAKRFILTKLLIFWALMTFVGLLFMGSLFVAKSSGGQSFSILDLLNSQMVRFQVWTAMSLVIIWLDHKFRAKSRKWTFLFPVHFLASIFWSAAATSLYCTLVWFFDGLINSKFDLLASVFSTLAVSNFVMGIVGYKIILTTNYALDYYKKFHEEKNRAVLLETQLAWAQLDALKMQLQPHFLFNTLNSISNLALENPHKAVQMIARLGDFLRLTIESNGTQQVSLERELEFLRCYLEIEQVRFEDRLKVEVDAAPETLSAEVPNLILQPLVENAIKHGISKSMSAGRIFINANRCGDVLRMQIKNDGKKTAQNGCGLLKEGVGMANTRGRLQQLYGDDFNLDLMPLEKGGATVNLEIPFRESSWNDDH